MPEFGAEPPAEPALEPEPETLPFRARLTVLQRQVLDALLAGDAAQVSSLCAAAMTFPDAVYEEINEIALEALGPPLASIRQMSRQVSRCSAGKYQADERAGVAWLRWRVSGR